MLGRNFNQFEIVKLLKRYSLYKDTPNKISNNPYINISILNGLLYIKKVYHNSTFIEYCVACIYKDILIRNNFSIIPHMIVISS